MRESKPRRIAYDDVSFPNRSFEYRNPPYGLNYRHYLAAITEKLSRPWFPRQDVIGVTYPANLLFDKTISGC